ncbi:MAG: methionyl-tRNA formyltransferase [Gammaproteobacteria bacterium TMED1]|nr:MAG: methionyl-tRNA formyltransferase [Gammaproteobacteria bacterium TMED1]|tara:strand:- start:9197 stop:10147 length:951 start_codon:yes stop_codon:yes gene_type:complete
MKIVFAGTPGFAAAHLKELIQSTHSIVAVVTQPDKPGKRGKREIPSPVKEVALAAELPVLQPKKLSPNDLKGYNYDLLVVVAFGQLLTMPIINASRLGCVNVHASLLPRWRGAAPIQRAILAGDQETGICIMQMDEGLDTGDVFCHKKVAILKSDTAATLSAKLEQAGIESLIDTLSLIEGKSLVASPQRTEGVTYAKKIAKSEALINWNNDAINIERHIRAFNPQPITHSFLKGLRIKIWEGKAEKYQGGAAPGTVLQLERDGIHIACMRSKIIITKVQLPMGRGTVLTAKDIVNSRRELFQPGNYFAEHSNGLA